MIDNTEIDVDIQERNSVNANEDNKKSFNLSPATALAGVTIATSLFGFMIVHVFLSSYASITKYTVIPSQYIGAGIGLWIFSFHICVLGALTAGPIILLLITFYNKIGIEEKINSIVKIEFVSKIIAPTLLFGLPLHIITLLLRNTDIQLFGLLSLGQTSRIITLIVVNLIFIFTFHDTYKDKLHIAVYIPWITATFSTLCVLSIYFSLYIYGFLPSSLGGGKPNPINIFYSENSPAEYLGLNLDDDSKSETVCLLANLFDGLMIYNPRTKMPLIVATGSQSNYLGHTASDEAVNCCSSFVTEICVPEMSYENLDNTQNKES